MPALDDITPPDMKRVVLGAATLLLPLLVLLPAPGAFGQIKRLAILPPCSAAATTEDRCLADLRQGRGHSAAIRLICCVALALQSFHFSPHARRP
jgi:hypothetical protein